MKTVYRASDGEEFYTKEECQKYEAGILPGRLANKRNEEEMEISVEIPFNSLALPPKERRRKMLERIVESFVKEVCFGDGYSNIDVVEARDGQECRLGERAVTEREAVEIGKMFVEKGYKASIDYSDHCTLLYITDDPDYDCNDESNSEFLTKTVEIGKDTVL